MERSNTLIFVTMTTILLFLFISTSSVLARPHVRPRLTLADLDEDGAIPKNDAADFADEETLALQGPDEIPPDLGNEIRFEAVDLPSHFGTYDLNSDRRVSLKELSLVTGTKEVDAKWPFGAADTDHDDRLSYDEFRRAPWIFGATQEVQVVDQLIHDMVGEDV